ncbi:P-loop containing nucleoside triphosphate hydrolase protein [Pisolithus tinctorius]|uniref:G domain-containing protein n=1 Tax=Pisolithus tinctorius Marx 270 TaxID=870435 RepID=A0A0C3NQJ9_PISTI|nr:P-loop containing nucleoside triphosphate hydrolase protein [Pisolithus tinctorius]KIN97583.1 hypothetical protein M404DRAFT_1005978 [Pisolithus tinctorius Marx 270]
MANARCRQSSQPCPSILLRFLMSPSQGRSLSRSPIRRGVDDVEGESSTFAAATIVSAPLGNASECDPYEDDRRTPLRSNWNVNTWLDRLHLFPSTPRDDTTVDHESRYDKTREILPPPTSPTEEITITPDDIVIAVMGPSDSGKTTYIDRAVGRPDVGCGSTSCTKEVRPVRYPHSDDGRNIILVDTPGCNDTFMPDFQVLGEITQWLNAIYRKNVKLSGILYFHRISDYRIREAPSRSYQIFKELCGRDTCKNVIFVTTMWDEVSEEVGSQREQELQSDFWRAMIKLGSTTHRFEGTAESARKIINSVSISPPAERRPLQIQREMVDKHLPLHKTAAGRTILDRLFNLMPRSEGIFARIKKGTKRTSFRTPSVTLTYDPTDTQPVGMGISSSGACSVRGYRSALTQVIFTLQAAVSAPELVRIHYPIAPCLDIALSIESMPETHHALFQVLETAIPLINVTIYRAKEARLTRDVKAAVDEFAKEMNHVHEITQDLTKRTPEARRILQSTDARIISSCAKSIRLLREVLSSASSIKYDLRSVDDGLGALKRGLEIDNCSCGIPTEPEQALSP